MLIASEFKSIQDCMKEDRTFGTFDLLVLIICVMLAAYIVTQFQEIINNHYKNKKAKMELKKEGK